MSIESRTRAVAALFTAAGSEVTACLADRDSVTVTCAACGPVDDVDFGPNERRCPDLDAAVNAAGAVAAEHAATCNKDIAQTGA